ncbi:MAG: hypothetical protein C0467_31220 [Planctomycetaceae bacterium]|nr:hypothetical protein [Planctomycetaceae bacterium]
MTSILFAAKCHVSVWGLNSCWLSSSCRISHLLSPPLRLPLENQSMPRFVLVFLFCLILVLGAPIAVGQPIPTQPRKLTPEQQEKNKERIRLVTDANKFESEGKLAEARTAVEKNLVIARDVFGESHSVVAESLEWLTSLCVQLEQFPAAREYGREALAARKKLHGESHWKTTDARLDLADVERRAKFLQQQRTDFDEASRLMIEVARLNDRHAYPKAREVVEKALALYAAILGEEHRLVASTLLWLGNLHASDADYSKAEHAYRLALTIRKKVLGEQHPEYARSLNNLGFLYYSQGLYTKAELLYKEALAIRKEVLGKRHPDYASSLENLAGLYDSQALFTPAEPLYKEALAIRKEVLGEQHPEYARSLNNLGFLYYSQGLYMKAEQLYKEALAIRKVVSGERHPDYATSLENLAGLYDSQALFTKAEQLYKEALKIRKEVLGEKHPEYARSLNNLGFLYYSQGLYMKAEQLYKEALVIRKDVSGERHPDYASSLSNLAGLYDAQGLYTKAEPLYKEALAIRKDVFGEKHPDYAKSLNNLASLYFSTSLFAKAEPLVRAAIGIMEEHLEQTAAIQTESSQLANMAIRRLYLNNLLLLPNIEPATVYAVVFRWRGAVTARQTFARATRGTDATSRQTLDQLRDVSRRLSNLVSNPPKPGPGVDISKLMKDLDDQREHLEKKLASQSKDFAKYRANRDLKVPDIQKLLPAGAALVDFLVHRDKVAAFIITPKSITRVDLKANASDLAEMVKDFRSDSSLKRTRPVQGEGDQSILREAVWEPLVPHIGDANLVLICPDGPLCQLPFAALRGTDPKKYLLEEVAIAVIPVPRLLPELLAERTTASPSLLVVGDVDFDAEPGGVPSRPQVGRVEDFKPLLATAGEIQQIEALFRKHLAGVAVVSLSKDKATTTAIRRATGKCCYLHLATHGFFHSSTAPTNASKLDGWVGDRVKSIGLNPALLCGLACAGGNKPTLDDRGVLTALEIAELDLGGVELAVLSACETGLGEVVDGDSVLGLQRAFQLAGTRTTVTTLWKVPDEATGALMMRFYENRLKKGMPVLKALREAQLWVLNEGVNAGALKEPPKNGRRTPPLYWAAFVLAGDWR